MHGHEQADTEHVEERTGSASVAVADAPVYGKHHHVKTVGELADVFQLAQETLFFLGRVNVDAEVGAVDQSPMIIVGQETGVPVVQVAGMEDTLAVGLYHPRHAAVVASGGVRLPTWHLSPARRRLLPSAPDGVSGCLSKGCSARSLSGSARRRCRG